MEAVLRVARASALALEEGLVRKHEFAKDDRVTIDDGSFCIGVFRVESENVAIKVMKEFKKCKDEWKLLSRLDHPNVIRCIGEPVFDLATPFFRMELINGSNLLNILLQRTVDQIEVLSALATRHVLLGVARALEYLHDCGIVHRDVKPENVLLNVRAPDQIDDSTAVKLCDFNLSHRMSARAPHHGGSSSCISPEVHRHGQSIGPETDVFGFGTLSYAIVTGWMTFTDEMLENYRKNWKLIRKRIASYIGFRVQPELRRLTMECLSWDAMDRPSARNLVDSVYFVRRSPGIRKARPADKQKI